MKYIYLFIWVLAFQSSLFGQKEELSNAISDLNNVDKIMEEVSRFYQDPTKDKSNLPSYKKWVRWAYEISSKTVGNGNLVNHSHLTRKAFKEVEREFGEMNNRSSTGQWNFVGPYAISGSNGSAVGIGRVDRIAFHPSDPNYMLIGTPAAGLLKTTNGGNSWTGLTDNMPSVSVSGIVISHDDPNKFFILTGDGDSDITNGFVLNFGYLRPGAGAFVSYDQGINWLPLAPFPDVDDYVGFDLVQDPTNANILLAATSEGLFRSVNGGNLWTKVLSSTVYDVAFKPNSSIAYATKNNLFLFSTDAGESWHIDADFDPEPPDGRIAIATTNALPNRVYLLSGAEDFFNYEGLYVSYNSGLSFTRQSNSPNIISSCCDGETGVGDNFYDVALAVNHSTPDNLITGAVRIWRSTDRGVTMINATPSCSGNDSSDMCNDGPGSSSTGFVHADVHMLAYNPLNNYVYACTDGGLHYSIDNGQSWLDKSDGITATQIYHMAGSQTNHNNLIIGTQDNGVKRRNGDTNIFDQVLSADGFDVIYNFGGSTTGYLSWNRRIDRFTNNASNLFNITPPDTDEWFGRVTSAINDPALVLVGYSDIYRSTDSGENWVNRNAAGNWDMERCPSNSAKYYAAGGLRSYSTTGNMYRSINDGFSWLTISNNSGYPTEAGRLTDIAVKPTNSNRVWIVFGGFNNDKKVFQSYDSGDSWTNISDNLPNIPINAIAVSAAEDIYIGTDIGVFYRGSGTTNWVPFSNKLPVVPVTDLELYDDKIRAATFGKGVWQSELYSNCVSTQFLTTDITGHKYFEVSNIITTTANIYGGQNTDVIMKAGVRLDLLPGFRANMAVRYRAYISPCGEVSN